MVTLEISTGLFNLALKIVNLLKTPLKATFGNFGGKEHEFFSLRAEALTVADYIALTNWVEENMEG